MICGPCFIFKKLVLVGCWLDLHFWKINLGKRSISSGTPPPEMDDFTTRYLEPRGKGCVGTIVTSRLHPQNDFEHEDL